MLETYQKKRNFQRTTEPDGKSNGHDRKPFYVVQKHDASSLHYDFRFLHEGTLKSWAIPKGPSLKPGEKRLAIRTEDHPVDYGDFEGTIPKDEYGGGTVLLWDNGGFKARKDLSEGLEKGRLQFDLDGEKLKGGFEMVRIRNEDEKEQWLLIKRRDRHAAKKGSKTVVNQHPDSVKTGRSLEEVAKAEAGEAPEPKEASKSRKRSQPRGLKPLLPTLVDSVPEGKNWLHEIKWDGYRLIAEKRGQKLRLLTRNGKDWTEKFASLAQHIAALTDQDFVLDGEAVILDKQGHSDFQSLQNAIKSGNTKRMRFYAFDLLYLHDRDLRQTPLKERKALLKQLLDATDEAIVLFSDHYEGNGAELHQHACDEKLEGIVSKRADSAYTSGRSRLWVKTKCIRRQEFIIAGYTAPSGNRKHFGSLVLAAHDEADKLVYAGRVGTGFNQASLAEIGGKLSKLSRKTSPLDRNTEHVPRKVHWVTPKLIGEVAYSEITDDSLLRHPSFQGLREDKSADEIQLDQPQSIDGSEDNAEQQGQNEPTVHGIAVTHADRVIDPASGLTKGDLVEYYGKVAPHMLPWLRNRPLSLVRCPQGREHSCFFQKHFEDSAPESVNVLQLPEKDGQAPYSYLTTEAGLASLAQFGTLEFHTWGSRIDQPDKPDTLIFDLDPGEQVPWKEIVGAAFLVRDELEELGLRSFVKTTGGKGLHVCVPLTRKAGWDEAKAFCKHFAQRIVDRNPKKFIAKASKSARKGKIFVDYLRNSYGATAIAPYSVRARPYLPVSVPVTWDELNGNLHSDRWNIQNLFERLKHTTDPWESYSSTRQSLTQKRIAAVRE